MCGSVIYKMLLFVLDLIWVSLFLCYGAQAALRGLCEDLDIPFQSSMLKYATRESYFFIYTEKKLIFKFNLY